MGSHDGRPGLEAVHDLYRARFNQAKTREESDAVLRRMIHELPSSHLAIIPARLYHAIPEEKDDDSGAVGFDFVAIDQAFAIEHVDPNGAAAKAGVHPGWIIQSVDGMSVKEFLENAPPGSSEDRQYFVQDMLDRWLHGRPGTSVKVVLRSPEGETVMLPIERQAPAGELVEFSNQQGGDFRTIGKDALNGAPCYAVEMDSGEPGAPAKACFDAKSGYLVRIDRPAEGRTPAEQTTFSDYRDERRLYPAAPCGDDTGRQAGGDRHDRSAIQRCLAGARF